MKGKSRERSLRMMHLFISYSDWDSKSTLSGPELLSDSSDSDSDHVTQPLSCDPEPKWSMKPSSTPITNHKRKYKHNWSKEEQITLLKSLIEFESHHEKLNIRLDPSIFEEYIQKKLNLESIDVTAEIGRLNSKFRADMERKPADNDDGVVFQLSRQLWGLEYHIYQRGKNPQTYPPDVDLQAKYPTLAANFHNYYLLMIQRNIDLIRDEKLTDLNKKLKNLQDEEARRRIVRDSYKWLRELDKKGKST